MGDVQCCGELRNVGDLSENINNILQDRKSLGEESVSIPRTLPHLLVNHLRAVCGDEIKLDSVRNVDVCKRHLVSFLFIIYIISILENYRIGLLSKVQFSSNLHVG